MKVLIVGAGKTLYFLCRHFKAKGYEVVVINRNPAECVQLARKLSALVICGDGSDAMILKEAGAREADVVFAITPYDQDNLVICQLAAMQFGVPRAIALANDPDNEPIFEKLGVSAFSTTQIVSRLIEERASLEQIINLLPVGQGRVNVTEMVLDLDAPAAGKFLKDIVLPEDALVAVAIRDDRPIVPRGGTQLLAGDRLVLITLPENHDAVIEALMGDRK